MPRDGGCLTEGEISYDSSSRIEPKRGHQWFMDTTGPELFSSKKQALDVEGVCNRPGLGTSDMNVSPWHNASSFQSVPAQFSDRLFGSEAVRTVNMVNRSSSGSGNMGSLFGSEAVQTVNTVDRNVPSAGNGSMGGLFGSVDVWTVNMIDRNIPSAGTGSMGSLFGSEAVQTVNLVDRNVPSAGNGSMGLDMGRKDFNDRYGSNSSMGLSLTHRIEDPSGCINFGGLKKVKVNQVMNSGGDISASMANSYGQGDNRAISMGVTYNKSHGNTISLGPTFNNGEDNNISIGPHFGKADGNYISMGHAFGKGDGNFISMGHDFSKGDDNILSMGQPFDKEDGNFITIGPSYEKEDSNAVAMATSFSKGHENFISMGTTHDKANENFISMGPYSKGDDSIVSVGVKYDKANSNITSMCSSQDKGDFNILSIGHNYKNGESNTISFGGFHDATEANPSGGIISGYGMLMGNHNSAQASEVPGPKDFDQSNAALTVNNNAPNTNSKSDNASLSKDAKASKKIPSNNFPSNVKSLLSTGMFDGIPVKYVSWSREKNVKGIIKGTGYLCGCEECNFSKALNAYEFERHANCKTKHPNNHIYFENGKTIYAVVQELKSTSQDMLFDAIQNVTGSPINQKNFRSWKASYQAATRELQRIYGKDEVVIPT